MVALIACFVDLLDRAERELRRAWLRFLLWELDQDIAMLKRQHRRVRENLYDFEARRHAVAVDLMSLEKAP